MADRQDELDLNQRPLGYESPRGHVGTPLIVPRNAVDETFGVDVSKRLIDSLFGYLSLSYTFLGSPPGSDLRDTFGWSLGAAYGVIPLLSVFAFLDARRPRRPARKIPSSFASGRSSSSSTRWS